MEEIRDSRKSMEQERVAHLPPQKNEVLESVLKARHPCAQHFRHCSSIVAPASRTRHWVEDAHDGFDGT